MHPVFCSAGDTVLMKIAEMYLYYIQLYSTIRALQHQQLSYITA